MTEEQQILKQFGIRVRHHRKILGLTQEQLGELAGINHKYLGEVERGRKKVNLIVILRLTRALQVSLSDFIHDTSKATDDRQRYLRMILQFLAQKDLPEIKRAFRVLKICTSRDST